MIERAATMLYTMPEKFTLESGAFLPRVEVAYETYGALSEKGDNAILVLHALTGDAHVAAHPENPLPGWWEEMVGPGKALDTNRYFVVASNVLGGCYGTTGPASIDPRTNRPYGMNFPVVTIRDMVRVQQKLLDGLGIKKLKCVIGGSMGGMQALEWAATFPDLVETAIPLATSARLTAQCMAYNQVQRRAIENDPDWQGGDYYPGQGPVKGLALARMIATITYKSDESWSMKFGRAFSGDNLYDYRAAFEVENYLDYQGRKLVSRFDANSYLYLTKAMDLHDLGRSRGYKEALSRIKARLLVVGISSDFLYPAYLQRRLHQDLLAQGVQAEYYELISPYGHDAFLIEFEPLAAEISRFLSAPAFK